MVQIMRSTPWLVYVSIRQNEEGSISTEVQNQFEQFVKDHSKTYGSEKEKKLRLRIFQENLRTIQELNASDRGTAVYGVTQFSDLTKYHKLYTKEQGNPGWWLTLPADQRTDMEWNEMDEFKMRFGIGIKHIRKYLSPRMPSDNFKSIFSRRGNGVKDFASINLEDGIYFKGNETNGICRDWTAPHNPYMTPVKNYGNCVASWAMGPVDAMEISYSANVKKITPLSVQQVIDCSGGNHCETPGKHIKYWETYFNKPGLVAETDYAWVGKRTTNYTCLLTKQMKILAKAKINEIKTGGDAAIAKVLAKQPVVTAINSAGFAHYKGGVLALNEAECPCDNPDNLVPIVGCGTEKAKDGQTLEYWVVKNQLGDGWGEKGFMRIKKGACATGLYHFYFPVGAKS